MGGTWIWAVEADEPVDFRGGDGDIAGTDPSAVGVVDFRLEQMAFGVDRKPTEGAVADVSGFGETQPLRHRRTDAVTANYHLIRLKNISQRGKDYAKHIPASSVSDSNRKKFNAETISRGKKCSQDFQKRVLFLIIMTHADKRVPIS